jgi:hypothetical protein
MEKRVTGYTIPEPSTAMYSDVIQTFSGSTLTLRFDYDRNGDIFHSGIQFYNVRAYRFRSESLCTAWHIEDAYDTLVEVKDSDWVMEVRKAMPLDKRDLADTRHYMIFLDNTGCYEVIAEVWNAVPEQHGPLEEIG